MNSFLFYLIHISGFPKSKGDSTVHFLNTDNLVQYTSKTGLLRKHNPVQYIESIDTEAIVHSYTPRGEVLVNSEYKSPNFIYSEETNSED